MYIYAIIVAVYSLSTIKVIQKLIKCSRTDPGLIPSVKKLPNSVLCHSSLSKLKNLEVEKHYVKYRSAEDLTQSMGDKNPAELFSMRKDILESTQKNKIKEFYSLNKFEYFEMSIEESGVLLNRMNKLTHCTECDILRPPRSFHCN